MVRNNIDTTHKIYRYRYRYNTQKGYQTWIIVFQCNAVVPERHMILLMPHCCLKWKEPTRKKKKTLKKTQHTKESPDVNICIAILWCQNEQKRLGTNITPSRNTVPNVLTSIAVRSSNFALKMVRTI